MSTPPANLSVIVTIVLYMTAQTVAAVWWAGTSTAKLNSIIRSDQQQDKLVADLADLVQQQATTTAVLAALLERLETAQRRAAVANAEQPRSAN